MPCAKASLSKASCDSHRPLRSELLTRPSAQSEARHELDESEIGTCDAAKHLYPYGHGGEVCTGRILISTLSIRRRLPRSRIQFLIYDRKLCHTARSVLNRLACDHENTLIGGEGGLCASMTLLLSRAEPTLSSLGSIDYRVRYLDSVRLLPAFCPATCLRP